MRRFDCLKLLAPLVSDDTLVVCNLQDTTYEWQKLRPSDGNLLRMGMAIVTPLAFGIATALPHRRVIALDGDGSMLLGPGAFTTLARYKPENLLTIIFDNEHYNSGGVVPTATAHGADLELIARGSGMQDVATATDLEEFKRLLDTALRSKKMWLIVAKVTREFEPVAKPSIDGKENKYRFVRFVEDMENTSILPTDEGKSFL